MTMPNGAARPARPTWDQLRTEKERLDATAQQRASLSKIDLMHFDHGVTSGRLCADCVHLHRINHHGQIYHKCDSYGLSHGHGTDWKLAYAACGLFVERGSPLKARYTE